MRRVRGRYVCACVSALCVAMLMAGCDDDKAVIYDVSLIEGDTVQEYEDGVLMTEGASDDVSSANDTVGGIGGTLGIPTSVSAELSADGTGLDSIRIKAESVRCPSSDRMYTKKFTMGTFSLEERERIVRAIFDEESGVYNYPYDLKDDVTREMKDALFDGSDGADFSQDYFIGKINDRPLILYFTDPSWVSDVGYYVEMDSSYEIPEDMYEKGARSVRYDSYGYVDGDEVDYTIVTSVDDIARLDDPDEPNMAELSPDQALNEALVCLADWGYGEVCMSSMCSMYKSYRTGDYKLVEADKDGYSITLAPSIAGDELYQPMAFGIDTISHESMWEENTYVADNYYYAEVSTYTIGINDDGVCAFTCMWPMADAGDIQDAGELITWDEALAALQEAVAAHFKDYEGYSEVTFNDVRLTYFRTKTGEGTYEVIPVYVFAECEDMAQYGGEGLQYDRPIQLIMLDARDGSEVSIVQDESRFNAK